MADDAGGDVPEAEEPAPVFDPDAPLALAFVLAHHGKAGRVDITTRDLETRGLPDLKMEELAGNHCRAGRFLIAVVARRLLKQSLRDPGGSIEDKAAGLSGIELSLSRDDVHQGLPMVSPRFPETNEAGPVTVRITLPPPESGPAARVSGMFSRLLPARGPKASLTLGPPAKEAGNRDQWLRTACRRLGMDTPAPKSFSALDADLAAASGRAGQRLMELRQRFNAGLPDDQQLLLKTGIAASRGRLEYVWASVQEWLDGEVAARLEVIPREASEFSRWQDLTIAEADILDQTLVSEAGVIVPSLTDIVAQDYGVDLA